MAGFLFKFCHSFDVKLVTAPPVVQFCLQPYSCLQPKLGSTQSYYHRELTDSLTT